MSRYTLELLIPVLLFGSTVLYYRELQKNRSEKLGSFTLLIAILYTMGIGLYSAYLESRFFIRSMPDAILFCISLIGIGQMCSEIFGKTTKLGVFTVFPLFLISLFLPITPRESWSIENPYFSLHILASMSAYSFFFIAAILGFMQILLWNRLKKAQFDSLYAKLPNLEKVEKYSLFWIVMGISAGLISGAAGIQWWFEERNSDNIPLSAFVIILPFSLIAIGNTLRLINGIHFSRAIFLSLITLIIIHVIGIH